jgi:uncharacterized protein (DUF488 family)
MTHPFFTIGHSTRSIADFVELLREADIKLVVDVRTVPRSRTNPQFNRDVLPITLSEFAIDYVHISRLGGLRAKSTTVPPSMNAFWQNASFHNYADYAMSEDFESGLMQLRELGHAKRSAICARRRFGGDVIAESSRTICSLAEMRRSTFSDGITLTERT